MGIFDTMRGALIHSSFDTFDGAKPRFLDRGKKRHSVSTLSIPRASDRGVEWVDFCYIEGLIVVILSRSLTVLYEAFINCQPDKGPRCRK